MRTAVLCTAGLMITVSSAQAAPDVIYVDTTFTTFSETTAADPAVPIVLMDFDDAGGLNWANAAQGSIANSNTGTFADAHAHGAVDGNAWESGFDAWGYGRSTTVADGDQEADARSNNFVQIEMLIDEATRATGSFCIMLEETLAGSYAVATLVRINDDESVDRIASHAWNDPGHCNEFDVLLQPGRYLFWGNAGTVAVNEGDGYHDAWAEFSAEIKFHGLPDPDVDLDGDIDGNDLAMFLGGWGTQNAALDFNGDQLVDGGDLAILLAAWQ